MIMHDEFDSIENYNDNRYIFYWDHSFRFCTCLVIEINDPLPATCLKDCLNCHGEGIMPIPPEDLGLQSENLRFKNI